MKSYLAIHLQITSSNKDQV